MDPQLFNILNQVSCTINAQLKNERDELARTNAVLREEMNRLKKQNEDIAFQGELYYELFKQEKRLKEVFEQKHAEEVAGLKRKIDHAEEVAGLKRMIDEEMANAPKRQRSEGVLLRIEVSKRGVRSFYERMPPHIRWSWGCNSHTRFMIVEILKRCLPMEIRNGLLYVGYVEQWQETGENTMMISFKVLKEVETDFVTWIRTNLF